jgi:hypothetical protein
MAVPPTSAVATISSSMPGGVAAPQFVQGPKYQQGTPGNSYLPPGAACPEAVALMAGKAVTHVQTDHACKGIQGITIIIGDTFNSIDSAISLVNVNFGCRGGQLCCASTFNLPGPVVS